MFRLTAEDAKTFMQTNSSSFIFDTIDVEIEKASKLKWKHIVVRFPDEVDLHDTIAYYRARGFSVADFNPTGHPEGMDGSKSLRFSWSE